VRDDFVRILKIDRKYRPDKTVSPRMRTIFDEALASLPPEPEPPPPTDERLVTTGPLGKPQIIIQQPPPTPTYKKWWVWTSVILAVGAASAAISTGLVYGLNREPSTALGTQPAFQ
jgi:hypothetical protein